MADDDFELSAARAEARACERQHAEAQALAHVGSWVLRAGEPAARAFWSDELCRIFGRPLGFAPTWAEFESLVHPDDRGHLSASIDAAQAHGDESATPYRIFRPSGEMRYVHSRRFTRRDGAGHVTHLYGTIQDITAQHRAEAAREEAENLFEMAFAHAPIGMAVVDRDGRWLKVNPAFCRITGWPELELLKLSYADITHPDDLAAEKAHVARLMAGEIRGHEHEKRYRRRDGTEIWVRVSVSVARTEDGAPTRFISQIEDVSSRRRDHERLRAAERHARAERDHATAIIAAMHEGYALTVGGEVTAVNEALCRLTGYTEDELVGARLPFPFWPPEARDENLAIRDEVVQARGGTFEVTLMRKTGERFEAEVTAQLAFDPAGESIGFVNTVRDISGLRRHQRELERLARTDSLTGLANRHVLQQSLERAAALAWREESSVALVLLDIDWFKQVNDRHGHPVGDAVLVDVARRLTETVRPAELLARVGGEEFAWLLPGATAQQAVAAADRARRAIAALPFPGVGALTMSAGVGLIHAPSDGDALYRLADRALYEAKRNGRSRTSVLVAGYPASGGARSSLAVGP